MPKARTKHTPRRRSRGTRTNRRAVDPSIALGLRYLAAYRAFTLADAERDEMDGDVWEKYPQAPEEICFPNVPNPNVLRDEEDILRMPEPARSKLLGMLGAEERKRANIDLETGYAAKVAEVKWLTLCVCCGSRSRQRRSAESPSSSARGCCMQIRTRLRMILLRELRLPP
jgi:hypothetical protein